MTAPSTVPPEPICRTADDTGPCPYWQHCHEVRQRIHSGQQRTETGRWFTVGRPIWGDACWAFQLARQRGVTSATEPVATREPGEEPF